MDKRTLTPVELQLLKQFIISRSARFAEPVILLEILDHFACKTEELLTADPRLGFDEAMRKAHQSFGIKGFAPLAASCEQGIYQKYKQLFRKLQRELLFSGHMLGFLAAGLLCFNLLLLLNARDLLPASGIELVLALDLGCFIMLLVQRFRNPYRGVHKLFYEATGTIANRVFLAVWMGAYMLPLFPKLSPVVFAGATGALFTVLLFTITVHGRLMRIVQEDMALTDQHFRLIS